MIARLVVLAFGGLQPNVLRVVGLVTVGFGSLIVWSLWPQRSEG